MCNSCPSDQFDKEHTELVAELAHYVLVNNLSEEKTKETDNQWCYHFRRLSASKTLTEAGFTASSPYPSDIDSSYQKKLLDVRRWLTELGIFKEPWQQRVQTIFYTPLGLILRKGAVADKEASLSAFQKAFRFREKKSLCGSSGFDGNSVCVGSWACSLWGLSVAGHGQVPPRKSKS